MPIDEKSRLAIEMAFYAEHKAEWLEKHSGEYVVAQDTNLLGFYDSFESAFKAGVIAFGVQRDFLVKQVLAREPIYSVYLAGLENVPKMGASNTGILWKNEGHQNAL